VHGLIWTWSSTHLFSPAHDEPFGTTYIACRCANSNLGTPSLVMAIQGLGLPRPPYLYCRQCVRVIDPMNSTDTEHHLTH
jgi:hypothetical protein